MGKTAFLSKDFHFLCKRFVKGLFFSLRML